MAGGFTQVNGQILDPSGNVYANARIFASFIGQNTTPGAGPYLLGGLPSGQFETIVVEQADSFGNFNMLLADNNVVLPSPSQWSFTVVAQDGKTAFGVLITITGATQTITSQLQAAAAPLVSAIAFNSATIGKLNGIRYVDGIKFPTIQSAINDLGSPAFGTIIIPPGTYTQNTSLTIPLGSSIQFQGAGRGATIINSSLTSGDLFPFQNMSEWSVRGITINNTGAGGGRAFHCNYSQRCLVSEFTITGPWADGIYIQGREGVGSAIFIAIRDGLITGPTSSCITYDSTGETNQTVNSNQIVNVSCTCGGTTGKALQILGPNFICNENLIECCQFTAPGAGGIGVSVANSSARDLVLLCCTLEGSGTGLSLGTGNTVIAIGTEISANTTNISGDTLTNFFPLRCNIGGVSQTYGLDKIGNLQVASLSIGATTPVPNFICVVSGDGLLASGSTLMLFNNNSLEMVKNIIFDTGAGITQYNGIATVGNGVSASYSQSDLITQNSNIGATNLLVGTASSGGHWECCFTTGITTSDASGATYVLTLNWTENGIARTFVTSAIPFSGGSARTSVPMNVDNSTNVTFSTTVTGAPAAGKYDVHIWLKKQ